MELRDLLIDLNIIYEEFLDEASKVRSYAPKVGKSSKSNEMYSSLMIHDISDGITDLDISDKAIIDLMFEVYEMAPSYSVLMYLVMMYDNLNLELKEYIMNRYADYLFQDDEHLSVPVGYSLWVDYFEGDDRVEFCYNAIFGRMKQEYNDIKKLIDVSGPVPYHLKKDLYYTLTTDRIYHDLVYDGIVNSISDVYGHIPLEEATILLGKLEIDKTTQTYRELTRRLGI